MCTANILRVGSFGIKLHEITLTFLFSCRAGLYH